MSLPPGRELSDAELMQQLGGFMDYRHRGGGMSFADWADTKDFAPSDRDFLEVAFMGATMPHGMAC